MHKQMTSHCYWTQIPRLRYARDDSQKIKNKKLPILFANIRKIFTQGREA